MTRQGQGIVSIMDIRNGGVGRDGFGNASPALTYSGPNGALLQVTVLLQVVALNLNANEIRRGTPLGLTTGRALPGSLHSLLFPYDGCGSRGEAAAQSLDMNIASADAPDAEAA